MVYDDYNLEFIWYILKIFLQSLYQITSIAISIVLKSSLTVRSFKMENHYSTQCCRTVIDFVQLLSNCSQIIDLLANCCRTVLQLLLNFVQLCRIVVKIIFKCYRIVQLLSKLLSNCWGIINVFSNCFRFVLELMSNCVE